jgi:hypothetical protein
MSLPAPRASRRSFLKLGALAAVGALAATSRLVVPLTPTAASSWPLRLATALPLPGLPFLPFPEQLLRSPRLALDAALVPAYVAAQMIQRGWLQPLPGPAGRAHDPEGHYTLPFAYRVAALRYASGAAAPQTAGWADVALDALDRTTLGRLAAGAALLRRGYSPNDTHPGHLAQAAGDLARARPGAAELVLIDPRELEQTSGWRLPSPATMWVEYDWVIAQAAARGFVDSLRPLSQPAPGSLPARLIPLMPLPAGAQAQHDALWTH